MERVILLVSDLDGTLLGEDSAIAEFSAFVTSERPNFLLAYSSGRFVASMRRSIEDHGLPEPDVLIGGVGTELFDVARDEWIGDWPFLRGGWDPECVRAICLSHAEIEAQPADLSSLHKVSFFGRSLDRDFFDRLAAELANAGQAASIVYSSNRDLDVLPAGIHKGAAAAFVARRWRVDSRKVIVAGDSGNDLAMFREGFRGIVVANAHEELITLDDANVYQAKAKFASGVVEGLRHWRERC